MNYKMPYPIQGFSTKNRRRPSKGVQLTIAIVKMIVLLIALAVVVSYLIVILNPTQP